MFPVLYPFTAFYFLFMLLTMLTWTRYIVSYLNKNGRSSNMLLFGAWTMFGLGVLCLILNLFYPFIFSFNDAYEYIPVPGRHIFFILQIVFYLAISVYINDTKGHVAGDEYIKASSGLLCEIFAHSPVFRVGGDEFVVFLRGNDYLSRVELVNKLRSRVLENQKAGEGPVLAAGMAQYEPASDKLVQEIFDRADKEMYADKERLKKQ